MLIHVTFEDWYVLYNSNVITPSVVDSEINDFLALKIRVLNSEKGLFFNRIFDIITVSKIRSIT